MYYFNLGLYIFSTDYLLGGTPYPKKRTPHAILGVKYVNITVHWPSISNNPNLIQVVSSKRYVGLLFTLYEKYQLPHLPVIELWGNTLFTPLYKTSIFKKPCMLTFMLLQKTGL